MHTNKTYIGKTSERKQNGNGLITKKRNSLQGNSSISFIRGELKRGTQVEIIIVIVVAWVN